MHLPAHQYIPPADIEVAAQTRKVRIEESAVADELMARMAARVSKNRMVVLPPFKDFDRAVIGTGVRACGILLTRFASFSIMLRMFSLRESTLPRPSAFAHSA